MPDGTTICAHCGWDATTAIIRPPRRSLKGALLGGGWRLLVLGFILLIPLVGFTRFRATGPGPDLATTLRWMVAGDGGRAAELITIHRAHEIAAAAARYGVRELAAPSFEGDWEETLAPYATMHVRGWMPLLFYSATTGMAPHSVEVFYEVRAVDGWGRPYRITTRELGRGRPWHEDEQVAADLEAGLRMSFFEKSPIRMTGEDEWLRLEITSAGRDGSFATDDDLTLVSYLPTGFTIHLSRLEPEKLNRELEAAYTKGSHHFRLDGSRWDLIDARLLAEHRLEYLP